MPTKKFSLVIKKPIKDFKKKITVDSDKSISIRSFLLGSISQGISSVKNVLSDFLNDSFVWFTGVLSNSKQSFKKLPPVPPGKIIYVIPIIILLVPLLPWKHYPSRYFVFVYLVAMIIYFYFARDVVN